jgi:hypothetical protein
LIEKISQLSGSDLNNSKKTKAERIGEFEYSDDNIRDIISTNAILTLRNDRKKISPIELCYGLYINSSFFNHSCDPNCFYFGIANLLIVKAIKDQGSNVKILDYNKYFLESGKNIDAFSLKVKNLNGEIATLNYALNKDKPEERMFSLSSITGDNSGIEKQIKAMLSGVPQLSEISDFIQKKWKAVVTAADAAIPQCADKTLESQYAYLRAVAAGQLYNEDTLIVGLTKIITNYKDKPVAELARIYLSNFTPGQIQRSLGIETPKQAEESEAIQEIAKSNEPKNTSVFTVNPNDVHYVVLLVKTDKLPLQTVKQNLSNFNKTSFSLMKLVVSSFMLDNKNQMVTISKFKDKEEAMNYYHILLKDSLFKDDINNQTIQVYAMSTQNYTTFYNKRDQRVNYPAFFKENYLNNK